MGGSEQGVGIPSPGASGPAGGESSLPALGREEGAGGYNRRNIDDPVARCIPEGPRRRALYPNPFVSDPHLIVILVESRHVFRLIPLNAKHPDDWIPATLRLVGPLGGRYAGSRRDRLQGATVGSKISTDALHITERFHRVDYNTINYEAR